MNNNQTQKKQNLEYSIRKFRDMAGCGLIALGTVIVPSILFADFAVEPTLTDLISDSTRIADLIANPKIHSTISEGVGRTGLVLFYINGIYNGTIVYKHWMSYKGYHNT